MKKKIIHNNCKILNSSKKQLWNFAIHIYIYINIIKGYGISNF